MTQPITYRVSPEVDRALKTLAKKYGGVDKALKALLAAHAKETFKPGDYAKAGDHKFQILEEEEAGQFKAMLLDGGGLIVKVDGSNLTPYSPSDGEILRWKWKG